MERQLLMALVLMMLVLVGSQYLFKTPPGPKPVKPNQTPTADQVTKPAALPPVAATPPPPGGNVVAAAKEDTTTIDTNLYRVVFTNKGALVRSWTLKKYRDVRGQSLELVNPNALGKTYLPFAVEIKGTQPPVKLNEALFVTHPQADGLGVEFEYSDSTVQAHKAFRFKRDSYLSEVQSSIAMNGRDVPHLLAWRGGFGDQDATTAATSQHSVRFETANNKLILGDAKDAKNGPVSVTGSYSFAGLEDTFFAGVFLPREHTSVELQTLSTDVMSPVSKKEEPRVGAAVGSESGNQFTFFVGPKDIDLLRIVDPKLTQIIDWGWLSYLAKWLFLALKYVNDHFTHNFGWAIVLLTVIINFLLLPLKYTGMKSTKKMQALKPQVDAVNAKYKALSLRDPKKQQAQAEIMELYSKNGVNPAGGCLPMILQLPFFFAFFKVLSVAIELRGAPWLWISDLSQPETLPIRILPVLMVVSQVLQQKMTPSPGVDPAQQKMMYIMPLVFAYIFYGFASGLVLYYLTANLVGIVQQLYFNRISPTPAVEVIPPVTKKRPGRR